MSNSYMFPREVAAPNRLSVTVGVIFYCLIAFLSYALVAPSIVGAQESVIDEVVVANSTTDLLLYCVVGNGFTAEMGEGVRNGLPVTFTFFVELEQKRSLIPNRKIASLTFDHTLSYDSLKEEYKVFFLGNSERTLTTRSFEEAKRWMAEVNGFKVVSLSELQPDGQYVLSVKARLAKKTLPLNFHYIVPFWHLWDFETDWRDVQFRY